MPPGRLLGSTLTGGHGAVFFNVDRKRMKIALDATCEPLWEKSWMSPPQWGVTNNENWATKAGAAGFIPEMIRRSSYYTEDDEAADAHIVVYFARAHAAGPAIGQQQCLQKLRERSKAWKIKNGSTHFFILTDSRGPCGIGGQYKDVEFLKHHIIGPHGEEKNSPPFFRGRPGPSIPCFDNRKDVAIPTPNVHSPLTPFSPALPPLPFAAMHPQNRPLLMFYAGQGYECRKKMTETYGISNDTFVVSKIDKREYRQKMMTSKFCPICGGYSQWTPRVMEAIHYGCVPVLLNGIYLPPFSSLLNWTSFSVSYDISIFDISDLRSYLKTLNHAALMNNLLLNRHNFVYNLNESKGDERGVLPLIVSEMETKLTGAGVSVREEYGVSDYTSDIDTDEDYDLTVQYVHSQCAHAVSSRSSFTLRGKKWYCVTTDGYHASCGSTERQAVRRSTHRPRGCREDLKERGW